MILWCKGKDDKLSIWLQNLLKTKHPNKVTVALAEAGALGPKLTE